VSLRLAAGHRPNSAVGRLPLQVSAAAPAGVFPAMWPPAAPLPGRSSTGARAGDLNVDYLNPEGAPPSAAGVGLAGSYESGVISGPA